MANRYTWSGPEILLPAQDCRSAPRDCRSLGHIVPCLWARELRRAERDLAKTQKEIQNLVMAVAGGADYSLLLDTQAALKSQSETLATRTDGLRAKLAVMPDAEQTKRVVMFTRLLLLEQHSGKALEPLHANWWA